MVVLMMYTAAGPRSTRAPAIHLTLPDDWPAPPPLFEPVGSRRKWDTQLFGQALLVTSRTIVEYPILRACSRERELVSTRPHHQGRRRTDRSAAGSHARCS